MGSRRRVGRRHVKYYNYIPPVGFPEGVKSERLGKEAEKAVGYLPGLPSTFSPSQRRFCLSEDDLLLCENGNQAYTADRFVCHDYEALNL